MNVVLLTGVFSSWVILLCSSAEKRDKSLLKPMAVLSVCLWAETGGWRLRQATFVTALSFIMSTSLHCVQTLLIHLGGRIRVMHTGRTRHAVQNFSCAQKSGQIWTKFLMHLDAPRLTLPDIIINAGKMRYAARQVPLHTSQNENIDSNKWLKDQQQ